MAVYTDISKRELDLFLALYDIEEIVKFTGIKEGVENSNFLLESSSSKYILTIFEKRTDENDLPFFFNLMNHLNDNEIKCPQVIKDKLDKLYNFINDKPAVITSFLDGMSIKKIAPKLKCFTPGIRMEDVKDDQKRTMNANEAIKEGSDCLIIGRPITKGDPKKNIKNILSSIN